MNAKFKENARQIPRTPGSTVGPVRLTVGPDSFTADVHDISIIGVGLIGEVKYPPNIEFVVECGPNGSQLQNELTATLQHATQRTDGRWLLGCRFSRYLTADDLDILGKRSTPS